MNIVHVFSRMLAPCVGQHSHRIYYHNSAAFLHLLIRQALHHTNQPSALNRIWFGKHNLVFKLLYPGPFLREKYIMQFIILKICIQSILSFQRGSSSLLLLSVFRFNSRTVFYYSEKSKENGR